MPDLQIWTLVFNGLNDCWLEFDVEFQSSHMWPRSTASHIVNYPEPGFSELTFLLCASVKPGSSHRIGWFWVASNNLQEFIGGIASSLENGQQFGKGEEAGQFQQIDGLKDPTSSSWSLLKPVLPMYFSVLPSVCLDESNGSSWHHVPDGSKRAGDFEDSCPAWNSEGGW